MMAQKITIAFGILICVMLVWNISTIQKLESRIARLEAEQDTDGDGGLAQKSRQQDIKTMSDRSNDGEQNTSVKGAPSSSKRLYNSSGSKHSSDRPSDNKKPLGVDVLGFDDPKVKEVFDEYLDQYLKNWQDSQNTNEMSKFLDHLATTTEVFCEESGLTEDIQERIIQRLEKAHEDWIAGDIALEKGEIDQREYLERNGTIEKEVMKDMTEMIGEESWEKLAERIWNY